MLQAICNTFTLLKQNLKEFPTAVAWHNLGYSNNFKPSDSQYWKSWIGEKQELDFPDFCITHCLFSKRYFQPILKGEIYCQHLLKCLQVQVEMMGNPWKRAGVGGSPVGPAYNADWDLQLNLLSLTAVFFWFWGGYVLCLSNYFNSCSLGEVLFVSVNPMVRMCNLSVWKTEGLHLYWCVDQQLPTRRLFIICNYAYWKACVVKPSLS